MARPYGLITKISRSRPNGQPMSHSAKKKKTLVMWPSVVSHSVVLYP